MKVLIIPDAHAHPDYDNNRFLALGQFILAERPDTIVCLGDFADMPSLSSYDRGTRGFEGRRYSRDIESARDAQDKLLSAMRKHNKARSRNKKAQYTPRMVMCLGNHEDRIDRATNADPVLHGHMGMGDLGYEENGWEVVPFKVPVAVGGFHFCHYFASGVSGRPIGGENVARSLLTKQYASCIVGHGHTFDLSERVGADGRRIVGMSAGCYTHPDYVEGWCTNTVALWWRGVVVLEGAKDGDYRRLRAIRQADIEENYG